MKFAITSSLIVSAAFAIEANHAEFLTFAAKFGKSFNNLHEYKMRLDQYEKTAKFVEEHNN